MEDIPMTKDATTPPQEKIAKYFRIDRDIAKQLKLYAVEHEMKEAAVVEKALLLLLSEKTD